MGWWCERYCKSFFSRQEIGNGGLLGSGSGFSVSFAWWPENVIMLCSVKSSERYSKSFVNAEEIGNGGSHRKIWLLCLLLLTTRSDCWAGEHSDTIQIECKWRRNTNQITNLIDSWSGKRKCSMSVSLVPVSLFLAPKTPRVLLFVIGYNSHTPPD